MERFLSSLVEGIRISGVSWMGVEQNERNLFQPSTLGSSKSLVHMTEVDSAGNWKHS